ncbi:MAG TPA: GGDEF domain-containing protein [Jatrophihabitans sp.]|nr:GGDEF domain-containing protein [Jatrophihabitans sp.]
MLDVQGTRSRRASTWQPCYQLAAHSPADALAEHVRCIAERRFYSLIGLEAEATAHAAAARAAGLPEVACHADLIAIEVRSRQGAFAEVKAELMSLLAAAPRGSALAGRIRMLLATTCDRLGERTEGIRWIRQALSEWPDGEALHWRAEALMVAADVGASRTTNDYALMHHAASEVTAHGDRLLVAATLGNFAEACAEVGDLAVAAEFADAGSALLRRHPELASALTLDSLGRARLALGELATAHYCLELALRLEERLHCTDVRGDPWLTFAELKLALGEPDEAWSLLEHPRRTDWAAKCSWTRCRDLALRGQVLAAQGRWEQAYRASVAHVETYQALRSLEGDRTVAEFATVQIADEERRRAAEFEKLALTDPLTSLANRRQMERWLADTAQQGAGPVALAIVDLDHFKRVNDSFSHEAGDEVLRRVGEALARAGSGTDVLIARLGGEEFVQLSRRAALDEAAGRAQALLAGIRELDLAVIDPALRITASIGLAVGDPAAPSVLLRAADRCLYEAKRAGRDRLVVEPGG